MELFTLTKYILSCIIDASFVVIYLMMSACNMVNVLALIIVSRKRQRDDEIAEEERKKKEAKFKDAWEVTRCIIIR